MLTRQEEIREGIRIHLLDCFRLKGCWGAFYENFADSFSKSLPIMLDGRGYVLKVDRELPKRTWYDDWGGESGKAGYELALKDMAGCVAIEPLIEEN